MAGEEGERKGMGVLPGGRVSARSFVQRVFIFFLPAGTFEEDFSRIFISFPGVSFQGAGLH